MSDDNLLFEGRVEWKLEQGGQIQAMKEGKTAERSCKIVIPLLEV